MTFKQPNKKKGRPKVNFKVRNAKAWTPKGKDGEKWELYKMEGTKAFYRIKAK